MCNMLDMCCIFCMKVECESQHDGQLLGLQPWLAGSNPPCGSLGVRSREKFVWVYYESFMSFV